MENYIVYCTKTYNGSVVVQAESEDDAVAKVEEMWCKGEYPVDFEFSEKTADFAELEDEDEGDE